MPEFIRPIAALVGQLESRCRTKRAVEPGSTILVDLAIVSDQFSGAGIYQSIRRTVQEKAKTLGYQRVIGELSSSATQHFCVNKLGHQLICEIPYQTFEYEGDYPFPSVINPMSIQLVEGTLTTGA